ncbi:dihydroxy-acid dehydratase, partial [Brevundimonas sp.]|uniref:dihydroxy-acid dehydratase domain-containing protein n=1 Tax=Brevundimonas sp. TaxID=1871086 RepID=UPI003524B8C9
MFEQEDHRCTNGRGASSGRDPRQAAAAGGSIALLKTGDRVRIDLNIARADVLIPDEELAARRAALEANGGY